MICGVLCMGLVWLMLVMVNVGCFLVVWVLCCVVCCVVVIGCMMCMLVNGSWISCVCCMFVCLLVVWRCRNLC